MLTLSWAALCMLREEVLEPSRRPVLPCTCCLRSADEGGSCIAPPAKTRQSTSMLVSTAELHISGDPRTRSDQKLLQTSGVTFRGNNVSLQVEMLAHDTAAFAKRTDSSHVKPLSCEVSVLNGCERLLPADLQLLERCLQPPVLGDLA